MIAAESLTDEAVAHLLGPWRAAAAGRRVFVPAVLIDAAVQGVLVVGDPVPAFSWGFWLLVAASLLTIVVTVSLVTCAAATAVGGPATSGREVVRSRLAVLVLSSAVAVLGVAAAILHPLLPPLILLLAAFALPAVAAGGSILSGFTAVAAAPARYLFAVVGFVVLCGLSWVLALVLGLFVTGSAAAAVTWMWFGIELVIVLCVFSSLYRRSGAVTAVR